MSVRIRIIETRRARQNGVTGKPVCYTCEKVIREAKCVSVAAGKYGAVIKHRHVKCAKLKNII